MYIYGLSAFSLSLTYSLFNKKLNFKSSQSQILLKAFSDVYEKPNLTWDNVSKLLSEYVHPQDRHIIWTLPLRQVLMQSLLKDADYCDSLYETFITTLHAYLKTEAGSEIDQNILASNYPFFAMAKEAPLQEKLFEGDILKHYWDQIGYQLYCQGLNTYATLSDQEEAKFLEVLGGIGQRVQFRWHHGTSVLSKLTPKEIQYQIKKYFESPLTPPDSEEMGDTVLHRTLREVAQGVQSEEAALTLIQSGEYNLKANAQNITPLHLVCAFNQPKMLQALLAKDKTKYFWQRKLSLNGKDNDGKTPLHYAAGSGSLAIFKILLLEGANLTKPDNKGNLPHHLAALAGQTELLQFIYDSIKADKQKFHFPYFSKKLKYKPKNHKGETPALVAEDPEICKLLSQYDPTPADFGTVLLQTIHRVAASKKRLSKNEVWVAKLLKQHKDQMIAMVDTDKNNALHHCVLAGNYRMAQILMFPLTQAERLQLCQAENSDKRTPLALISDKIKTEKDKIFITQLNKIKRLLLWNLSPRGESHLLFVQDMREELLSTTSYQRLSTVALMALPLYQLGRGVYYTQNVWAGAEAAAMQLLGKDPSDVIERLVTILGPYVLPKKLLSALEWIAWTYGYYSHTTQRLSTEAVRQIISALATNQYAQSCSDNYLDYLYYTGAILLVMEELFGRQMIGPYLSEYWPGIESSLKTHFKVPTVNELLMRGGHALNQELKTKTGHDFKKIIVNTYFDIREKIGKLPSPTTLFRTEIEPKLMAEIKTKDEQTRNLLRDCFESLYLNQPADYLAKMEALFNWINTGVQNEKTISDLQEISTLIEDRSFAETFTDLFCARPLYQGMELPKSYETQIKRRMREQLNTDKAMNLAECANQTDSLFKSTYANTRKSPRTIIDDCKNEFGYYAYLSHYVAEVLVNDAPLFFKDTPHKDVIDLIEAYLNNVQRDARRARSKKHQRERNEDSVVLNATRLKALFMSDLYGEAFWEQDGLNTESLGVLNQYDGINVMAAFAVQGMHHFLDQTPGYVPLSPGEKVVLFTKYIDEQSHARSSHVKSHTHSSIEHTLRTHAQTGGEYPLLLDQYTLDQAADYIREQSKLAVNGRDIEVRKNKFRHKVEEKGRTYGVPFLATCIGAGFSVTATGVSIGLWNMRKSEMTDLKFELSYSPPRSLAFRSETQMPIVHQMDGIPLEFDKPIMKIDLVEKIWSENKDACIDSILTEHKLLSFSMPESHALQQRAEDVAMAPSSHHLVDKQSSLDYWEKHKSENPWGQVGKSIANFMVEKILIPIIPEAQANPMLIPVAAGAAEAAVAVGEAAVALGEALASRQAMAAAGRVILGFRAATIVADAMESADLGAAGGGGLFPLPYVFPLHQEDKKSRAGREHAPLESWATTFPVVPSRVSKTETLVVQPGKQSNVYASPKVIIQQEIIHQFSAFKKNGEKHSIKSRLKEAKLPIEGKIRYVPPPRYNPANPLPRGVNGGIKDRFDNEWIKGPSRTQNELWEWDVQLSQTGKSKLGWATRDGNHVNVSLKGRITHR